MRYTQGNLLDAQTEAVVNTVNTVGVMGKGVALMFKEAFPENYAAYAAACARGCPPIRCGCSRCTVSMWPRSWHRARQHRGPMSP